jgi:peptide chain release factor subunit 1
VAAASSSARGRLSLLVATMAGTQIATNRRMPITDQVSAQLDRLTALEPGPHPVVSLYLNLQSNERGRDQFDAFMRNAFTNVVGTYPAASPERESLDEDVRKIREYLDGVDPATNGLAIFACSGADVFVAMPLAAPLPKHLVYVSDQPHLYPLVRVLDEYPRYAVLVADTHTARLFVVAANAIQRTDAIEHVKTKRHKVGGWSQARYQRHVDNFRAQHAKDVVEVLTRTVRAEQIPFVIIGGDEVIVPLLKDELPKDIAERVIDVVRLDTQAPAHEILQSSLEAIRRHDVQTDRERVDALIGEYRSGGLATAGVDAVEAALDLGQVDELVIAAAPELIDSSKKSEAAVAAAGSRANKELVADQLVVKARQTAASIRFIEDPTLLQPLGGVGAFLRFAV